MKNVEKIYPEQCPQHGDLLKANKQLLEESDNPKAAALAFFDAGLHGLLWAYGGNLTAIMLEDTATRVRLLVDNLKSEG